MILLKLRASFGKLHEELVLHEGMNLLCLPNEAGKSTWSAFVLSMLYGIDTAERASAANQGLPAKERYKPWDGTPMSGSIDLLWEGRAVTIERTSGRVPLGNFRAYETRSGTPIPELTAENCGKTLCGVERSVFERTAFIRQLGLPVTADHTLEKRLSALVTTGEENGRTYSQLKTELQNLKNKLNGRAGRLPRLAEDAAQITQTLREIHALQDEAMALKARREAAEAEAAKLRALMQRIERARAAQKQAGLERAEQQLREQTLLCRRLEQSVQALPTQEALQELQREFDAAESRLQTAKLDAAFGVSAVPVPLESACFAGLSPEAARRQAGDDEAAYRRLVSAHAPSRLTALLGLLPAAVGVVLLFLLDRTIGLCLLGGGILLTAVLFLVLSQKAKSAARQRLEAQRILDRYGAASPEELRTAAEKYAAERAAYESAVRDADEQRNALAEAVRVQERTLDALIARVAAFDPACKTAADCREILSVALRNRADLATEQRTLHTLQAQLAALRSVLGDGPAVPLDAEALSLDAEKIGYELRRAETTLQTVRTSLAERQGAISAKGDPVALEARLEQLREAAAADTQTLRAIDLAMEALRSADESLRSRFSPQIAAEAGRLLGEMTGNRYSAVLLEPDMRMSVREKDGTVMRPAAAMSCGTADQMYLALRLAMCHSLLPKDVPLLLDDALVNFDDERAAAALRLLEKENRQVLLFTCRRF